MTRIGNTFTVWSKTDADSTWTQLGSQTVNLSSTALIGLLTASGNSSVMNKSFYDQLWIYPRTCSTVLVYGQPPQTTCSY